MSESSTKDRKIDLQAAIGKLEAFSREASEIQQASPLQKTILLFREFIKSKIIVHEENKKKEVLQAIEIVNRERLLIQKMQSGTPEERKLADSFTKAIDTYNKSRKVKGTPEERNTLTRLLNREWHAPMQDLPKIDLPQQFTVEYHYPKKPIIDGSKHKISLITSESPPSIHLSKQYTELFQMKALALLERYGIASNAEARASVKNTPIVPIFATDPSKCTLEQTLTLFPGQTILVMGSSEWNHTTQSISRLFPETFSISLTSTQTGFPHPSQRAGWALANQLLPECPQRLDMLPNCKAFFETKKQVTFALLPNGKLVDKAKKLLKLKTEVFNTHKGVFIDMHKVFIKALIEASPSAQKDHFLDITMAFFNELECQHAPYNLISNVHQKIWDSYIAKPHQALFQAAFKEMSPHPGHTENNHTTKQIFEEALRHSKNEIALLRIHAASSYEKRKLDYIECIGSIVGIAAEGIILQYLSEDLNFPPPTLSPFERMIQTMAYLQAEDFVQELFSDSVPNERAIYSQLSKQMMQDTLVLSNNVPLNFSNELAEYYHQRHEAKLPK